MRIKAVPRHRTLESNTKVTSATENLLDEESTDAEKDYDSSDAIEDSYKAYAPSSNILIPIMAFTSLSNEVTLSSSTTISLTNDNNNVEVLDLSTKDSSNRADITSDTSTEPEDKLKDSFLYKIMTDPDFLKNIQNKNSKKFVCLFCKEEFATCEELTNHTDVKKNDNNQITCCACKKTFAEKRYLKYHQRCHSERTKFTCDICTKKYTRMDNLTRHNVLHVNPNKFACTMCSKTFTRKDLLNKHRKSHEKYNLYCVKCGKYFKSILTLANHQWTHREISNALASTVVCKTESSIPAGNIICKIENSVSVEEEVHKTQDLTSGESLVCKTNDVIRKT
ncbi:oocyte zinc finger protein XlCOF6-like [Nylanderia fulva]|uniref:oocyte zinc finger protein XlCOF6-like n=1 Tax=Nylanderia fulva TaxID=613905 RepID=UPI0010FADFD3|nr:oocyte zinc finger protein XlCOF6-like [Nylanderia fulva]